MGAYGVVRNKEFERDIRKFFNELPKPLRDKSVATIYARALMKMRNAMRARAAIAAEQHIFRGVKIDPGMLRKSIRVLKLKITWEQPDPAAMVYVKRRGSYKKGTAPWGLWLEYGTAKRTTESGANRGSVKSTPFFRPVADAMQGTLKADVTHAMQRYAQKELDKQITRWNSKAHRLMVRM